MTDAGIKLLTPDPANLVELGFIVDDAAVTQQLRDGYFTQAWASSARTVASCQ